MKNILNLKENRDVILSLEEDGFLFVFIDNNIFSAKKLFSFGNYIGYIKFFNYYQAEYSQGHSANMRVNMVVQFTFGSDNYLFVNILPSVFELKNTKKVIDYYEYLGSLFFDVVSTFEKKKNVIVSLSQSKIEILVAHISVSFVINEEELLVYIASHEPIIIDMVKKPDINNEIKEKIKSLISL